MGDEDERRVQALTLAKIAEQAERYEDMVAHMREILNMGLSGDMLTQEERNTLSVGYKNIMSVRRHSHRNLMVNMDHMDPISDPERALVKSYLDTIAKEVDKVIAMVITDVVERFTKGPGAATDAENKVFFHKLEGDYYRYGAEIYCDDTDEDQRQKRAEYCEKAKKAYDTAQKAAEGLPATNPIKLGLTLNQSVFYYEVSDH